MSIRIKLIAGLIFAALPLLIGGALAGYQTNRLDLDFGRLLRDTTPAMETLVEIDALSHRLISEAVSYALLNIIRADDHEIQEEKRELNQARKELNILLERYESLGRHHRRAELARGLRMEITALDRSAAKLVDRNRFGARSLLPIKEELEEHEEKLIKLLHQARGFEQTLLRKKSLGIRDTVRALTFVIAGATLSVILFLIAYAYLVNRGISRPLFELIGAADKLGEGKLDAKPNINSTDEIGQLADAFRRMAGRLRATTVSRLYMNDILESMSDMLLVVEKENGRIRTVNAALLKTLGYEANELNGRAWTILLDEEPRLHPLEQIRAALTAGETQLRWKKNKGVTFPVMFSVSLMRESGEELFVCTARDITDDVRNANILKHARDSAEAANRAKSEFLANISHELRTPLNAILGTTDLLNEASLPEAEMNHVKNLTHGGETLLRLINEILDSARIEAGGLELREEDFEFETWFQATCSLHAAGIKNRGLDYEVTRNPALPRFINGDPQRLRQVLGNLISNAMKFTSEGRVSVEAGPGTEPDTIRFAVTDTGIGVPPEKKELIFQAFEQVDTSITRRFGGTGLGLAICRQLVRRMGGDIRHMDGHAGGSIFEFQVHCPAVAAPTDSSEGEVQTDPEIPGSPRILLAEDNTNNSDLIRAFLRDSPCSLEVVPDGAQAVESFKAGNYDLVFMDVQMPVMDGYTAVREIRRWERETNTKPKPILALTAHAMREDYERSLEAGCDAHLTKPIRKHRLLETIANYLNDG